MILTDTELKDKKIYDEIEMENMRQLNKWGIRTHNIFEWLAFLTEEVGELSEAISEHHYRNGRLVEVKKEAVECATLAIKIADMIECQLLKELKKKAKKLFRGGEK